MSTTTISPRKSSRERKSRQTRSVTDDLDTDDPDSLIGDDDTEPIDDAEL